MASLQESLPGRQHHMWLRMWAQSHQMVWILPLSSQVTLGRNLTFLSLSFFICKMELVKVSIGIAQGPVGGGVRGHLESA